MGRKRRLRRSDKFKSKLAAHPIYAEETQNLEESEEVVTEPDPKPTKETTKSKRRKASTRTRKTKKTTPSQ